MNFRPKNESGCLNRYALSMPMWWPAWKRHQAATTQQQGKPHRLSPSGAFTETPLCTTGGVGDGAAVTLEQSQRPELGSDIQPKLAEKIIGVRSVPAIPRRSLRTPLPSSPEEMNRCLGRWRIVVERLAYAVEGYEWLLGRRDQRARCPSGGQASLALSPNTSTRMGRARTTLDSAGASSPPGTDHKTKRRSVFFFRPPNEY